MQKTKKYLNSCGSAKGWSPGFLPVARAVIVTLIRSIIPGVAQIKGGVGHMMSSSFWLIETGNWLKKRRIRIEQTNCSWSGNLDIVNRVRWECS
jgi:hypothetical protein